MTPQSPERRVQLATATIHTSERTVYRTCRLRWHFTSPNRLNLEPLRAKPYLTFGTAWHKAQEAYYGGHRDISLAKVAFLDYLDRWFKSLGDSVDVEDEAQYSEFQALGMGMLDHYAIWAPDYDKFEVLWVEREYTIEIPGLDDVMYSFKPDGLAIDPMKRYWILEHKSTDKMPTSFEWLLMDDQPGSYIWGIQIAEGIEIEGVLYTYSRKKVPSSLRVLNSGELSIDKRVDTTYAYALQQIKDMYDGKVPIRYHDFLSELHAKDNSFFHREVVRRNPSEITSLGRSIEMEAREMTSNPPIYRNPSAFNCGTCAFVAPCLSYYEGGDVESVLTGNYRVRE